MITDRQAKVIYDLYREQGRRLEEFFTLPEVFPGADKGQERRAVLDLAADGLVDSNGYGLFRLTTISLDAYNQWCDGNRRRSNLRRVWFRGADGENESALVVLAGGEIELTKLNQIFQGVDDFLGITMPEEIVEAR